MLKAIFDWFRQPSPKAFAPAVQPEAAPYKIEAAPQVAPTLEAEPVAPATVETKAPAKAAPRKTAPKAAAKPAAKKPAAMSAKKSSKPKTK